LGFAQVWLDGSSIGSSKKPIFSSGWTNNTDHFILTSTLVFQSAAVVGGRNNTTPAQSPVR